MSHAVLPNSLSHIEHAHVNVTVVSTFVWQFTQGPILTFQLEHIINLDIVRNARRHLYDTTAAAVLISTVGESQYLVKKKSGNILHGTHAKQHKWNVAHQSQIFRVIWAMNVIAALSCWCRKDHSNRNVFSWQLHRTWSNTEFQNGRKTNI